jgi:hypothetical protein
MSWCHPRESKIQAAMEKKDTEDDVVKAEKVIFVIFVSVIGRVHELDCDN